MDLAILLLTYKRVDLLKKCLESIQNQEEHSFNLKYHILVNGSDSATEAYLESEGIAFSRQLEPLPVGEARNRLIEKISEPLICFLDDDIVLPKSYFKKAANILREQPDIDIFGGPDQNTEDSSPFQECLSLVMESFLANGPTASRHKKGSHAYEEGDELNLILCNFWAKKSVFAIQKFPSTFLRNEENLLLSVLKDRGVKMLRVPDLFVHHNRKVSLAKLARVLFLAGIYRVVSMLVYPRSAKPIFFLHQGLIVLLIWSAFCWHEALDLMICGYLTIIGMASLRIAFLTRNPLNLPRAMVLFIVFNFTYPLGQFAGYLKGIEYRIKGKMF